MPLNEQQTAVMDWAQKGSGSLNLIARAGCGKSFTILHLANTVLAGKGKVYLGAFNKAIADELKGKIRPQNVTAGTMHSLGLRLWSRFAKGRSEIESSKMRGIARRIFPLEKSLAQVVVEAVSYAKQAGYGLKGDYSGTEGWVPLFDYYDLWDEIPGKKASTQAERVIRACVEAYDESIEMCKQFNPVIDFDDMILAPLLLGEPVPSYDWFLGDEWQDANTVRRELVKFVLKPGGRCVFVGDDKQSIFGFAGATNDSLEQTKMEFQCSELPLNVTYRCPKSVVNLAQTWVPDFTAHESAPEGDVRRISHRDFWNHVFRPQNDVVLCRNTRPLVGIAKRLRKRGVDCVVEGANGKGLIAIATKWGEDIEIRELDLRLSEYLAAETEKWQTKGREDKLEAVREKVEILRDFCEELDEEDLVSRLVERIERIFNDHGDRPEVLKLCTVHRSKGREWDRVFLVGRNGYMPSSWAKQEWELEQEENLQYVAVTRAKKELVEVEVPVPLKKSSGDPDWWEL